MFEVDSETFTSKPNPKQEFTHYFKESGAAAALQNAMMLLYRMPVKPTNLAEYFCQYFENGAQQIMRISLLKAELCYKREQLQHKRLKVEETENRIKQIVVKLGLTEEEFEEKFLASHIKEKNRLSIIEQYFKEMESEGAKTLVENGANAKDLQTGNKSARTTVYSTPKKDCVQTLSQSSTVEQHNLGEIIKELDPWGIICKGPKKTGDSRALMQIHHDSGADEYEDHDELDEDDGISLAEQFQQSSHDWLQHIHDDGKTKPPHKILTVINADDVKLTDFQGWSPVASRMNLQSRQDLVTTSKLTEGNDMEKVIRRPVTIRPTDMLKSQGNANIDVTPPHEQDNDAFLLDEDHFEQALKMMETNRETFDFEFKQFIRDTRKKLAEEVCDPICSDITNFDQICSPSSGSMHDGAIFSEDYYGYDSNESLGFVPGKMMNWTNHMIAYPSSPTIGEYDELSGEGVQNMMTKGQSPGLLKKGSKTPVEVPMKRIDSSCHCVLTGIYNTNEMSAEEADTNTVSPVEGNAKGHKGTKAPLSFRNSKDESTETEDVVLKNELQEVFKNRKSTMKKDKQKDNPSSEEQNEDQTHALDLFGMDLAIEVKKAILGFTPSELSNAPVDISQKQQTSTSGLKNKIKLPI